MILTQILIFKIIYMYIHTYIWIYVCGEERWGYVNVSASTHGVQKTESDLKELELQVTLSHLMWAAPA